MVELADRENRFERSDVPSLEEQNLMEEFGRRKQRGNPIIKVFALLMAVIMLNGTLVYGAALHMQWKDAAAKVPELAVIPGLTGTRSQITGILDPETLTASYYWTFVVHNSTSAQQEAQLKVQLPPRATVSRATLWVNGVAEEAAFNSTERVETAYNWITRMHRDPLLVTQTAPRTISIKAAPVEANGDMEFRLGITAAGVLKRGKVLYTLPRVTAANMDVSCKQDVHLTSENEIQANSPKLSTTVDSDTQNLCKGNISPADLQGLVISARRISTAKEFATRATHAGSGAVILAKLVPINSTTAQLALKREPSLPAGTAYYGFEDQAFRLSTLWAFGEIEQVSAQGPATPAGILATTYRVVSCVSGATVLERQSDYQYQDLTRDPYMVTSYRSLNFVLPIANSSFIYPVSQMAPFQSYDSRPMDGMYGVGLVPLGILTFPFGFVRGALQNTLSQSFSTTVTQLNALNAYSAQSGVSSSAVSSQASAYTAPSVATITNSWTANDSAAVVADASQAHANMETENRMLHDFLVGIGSVSGIAGCVISDSMLIQTYGGKSLVEELFGTPSKALASIVAIDLILLLLSLNFYGCISLAVHSYRIGLANDPKCSDEAVRSFLWFMAALFLPDISMALGCMKLYGLWFQANEAARPRPAKASA